MRLPWPKHGCFPPASTQIAAVFWKERLVTRIICTYRVSAAPHSKETSEDKNVTGREREKNKKQVEENTTVSLILCGEIGVSSYSLPLSTWGTLSLSFCQRYLHLFNHKTQHKLACLTSFCFAQHMYDYHQNEKCYTCRSALLMTQWMGIIAVDRPVNLAEARIGPTKTQTHTSKQTNELIQSLTPPPLSPPWLFCHCFSPPSFFVSSSTPIWCVWTRPLGANSLPWTPSAVWLSTVNWAWLDVSGRDGAVLSPVQRAAFCRPASSFTGGSTHRRSGCDGKGVCQALALHLSDFQSLMTYSCLGAPRQNHLFRLNLHLFCSTRKCVKMSLRGLFKTFFHNMIQKRISAHIITLDKLTLHHFNLVSL